MEAPATREHANALESELTMMNADRQRVDATTRVGVERAHALFFEAYYDFGAEMTPFNIAGEGLGTHFLGWLHEEFVSLPSIMKALMAYASLVTYEGAFIALSREGYRHFKSFKQSNLDMD